VKTTERESLEAPEPGDDAPEEEHKHKNPVVQFLGELPGLIIMAFVLALLIKTFLVQAFFIPSGSMEPTLLPGDRVLVLKVPYYFHDPRRGDIIVFEDPDPTDQPDRGAVGGFFHWMFEGLGVQRPDNEDFIKRVIGVPGDTVFAKDGQVFVNDQPIDEPYLTQKTADFAPVDVPDDMLFVLGDNRGNSQDSRFGLGIATKGSKGVGFIPIDKVIGKAEIIIWPPSRLGLLH
jgi:signal peptidase I